MRFRDFLAEKIMNSATYADIAKRLGDIAQVGFEFEMLVPEGTIHHYHNDPFVTTDTIRVDSIKSYDGIKEYFNIYSSTERKINSDFEKYVKTLRNSYMADHMDDYLNDEGDNEADAEEEAAAAFDKADNTDIDDWIKDEFAGNIEDFIDEYTIESKYGSDENSTAFRVYTELPEEDKDDDKHQTFLNVASSFKKEFGFRPDVSIKEKANIKKLDSWYIEPDGSIEGDGFGVELVSPPLPLNKALVYLKDVATWMQDNDFETNESTGLHINISIPDLKEKLDPLKLILFMGEKHVLAQFGRQANVYAQEHIRQIIKSIEKSGFIPNSEKEIRNYSWSILSLGKYNTVNLSKIRAGYLEFRAVGGEGYNSKEKINKVEESVLRFIAAVEIACDPDLERKNYLKKTAALFSIADDNIVSGKQDKNSSLPIELTRIFNYFRQSDGNNRIYQDWNRYDYPVGNNKAELLLDIIYGARNVLHRMNKTMEPKERVFFKMQSKKVGLTTKMIDDYFGDEIDNRADFKKMTGQ